MLKAVLRKMAGKARQWIAEKPPEPDLSSFYPWINQMSRKVREEIGWRRVQYIWGVLHAAHLAKMLGVERISVLELGVAGGTGLVQLERCAEVVERLIGTKIDVIGFDTGHGMPKPVDARDLPNLYATGDYRMDEEALKARLRRARLVLGPVGETILKFIASKPAPVGFISIDVDFYSSTKEALSLLEAPHDVLLPRIQCYLDDVLGYTFGDFNGERLAIAEFNAEHASRKVSQVYGLRFLVSPEQMNEQWTEKMYLAHLMDHPRYADNDGTMQKDLPLPVKI
jgi:hypothetical protein